MNAVTRFWDLVDKITEQSKDANNPATRLLMKRGMSFLEIQESVKQMRAKFCKAGLILPETLEELDIWTEEFKDYEHELPESLVDPMKILDRIRNEDRNKK